MLVDQRVEHDRTICLSIPSTCDKPGLSHLVPGLICSFPGCIPSHGQEICKIQLLWMSLFWVFVHPWDYPNWLYISVIRHRSETGETKRKWDCLHMFTICLHDFNEHWIWWPPDLWTKRDWTDRWTLQSFCNANYSAICTQNWRRQPSCHCGKRQGRLDDSGRKVSSMKQVRMCVFNIY